MRTPGHMSIAEGSFTMSVPLTPLRGRAFRAGVWAFAGYGASLVLRLAGTLVLTRFLAPAMYGVMAIATMVSVVIALLTDIGLSQNLIQSKRGDDPVFLDTAWTVQIVRGFILWAVTSGVAVALYLAQRWNLMPAGSVYASAVLPWVLLGIALSSVILGFQSTKTVTASRHFDQRRLMGVELLSQALALLTMMAIGALTHSVWTLVVGALTANVITLACSHLMLPGHSNRLGWDDQSLREIVAFGRWIFVSSFVGVFALNADRLILGALISPAELGQYSIAVTLVAAVSGVFSKLYAAVTMPVLSETAIRNPENLKEVFYRLRVPSDLVLLFIAGILASCGHRVVDLMYDRRYADAGLFLQILAVSLVWVRYEASQKLFLALGESRYIAAINTLRLVSIVVAIPLGYRLGGLSGAIWGVALNQVTQAAVVYWFNAQRGLNDMRRELVVFLAFPVGFVLAWLVGQVV